MKCPGVWSWTNPLPDIALHTMARDGLQTPDTIPSKEIILKARSSNKRVILNVGGVRHEVMWRMLEQVRRGMIDLEGIKYLINHPS